MGPSFWGGWSGRIPSQLGPPELALGKVARNRGAREHAYKETPHPLPGCVTLVTVTAPRLFICEEGHTSPASKNGLRINAAIRWVLRAQFLGDHSPLSPHCHGSAPLGPAVCVWPREAGRVSEAGGQGASEDGAVLLSLCSGRRSCPTCLVPIRVPQTPALGARAVGESKALGGGKKITKMRRSS